MTAETEKRRMGPFELGRKLGVGGMGIVYRATYLETGQQVALKVLSPDLSADPKIAKRFQREMDILRRLKHPHIIRYYGGSKSGVQRYYAMELLSGGALDAVLKQKKQFTWEETVDYAIQIAQALEHAHNASVIHRDLKPSNLLLSKSGKLKLSDFGIARDTEATQLTAAGKTVGTMAYMAPEQITGKHPISRKTDLYALGCVMFEMLAGRPPFQSDTQPELLFKHIEEEPPSVREFNMDVPVWLDRLIGELLEKHPEDRPFDALAVQVKLEEVRTKVAERTSLAASARETVASSTLKDGEKTVAALLGKKKKKRRKKKKPREIVPWYERAWFLSSLLAGIVALVVWSFWPEGQEKAFARAEELMASTDPGVWLDAEQDLRAYLEADPEGEHAEQAQKWLADIELERAVRQLERVKMAKPGYDPDTEAEKLYAQAKQYERFGDTVGALSTFESMERILASDDSIETRAVLVLARRDAKRLGEQNDGSSRVDRLAEFLADTDELYRQGKTLDARANWRSVVDVYGGKAEFAPLVKQAEERLDNPELALSDEPSDAETAPDAPE